ncbi:MAG: peptidase S15, partial [Planctomycetes bacterium]|nr:peptidase S15 [Planctomycetota bacterium]
ETAPLEEDLSVLGTPVVRLRLAVDKPQAMIAVRLNEVSPDGHSSRVTFGLLNLSHRFSHEKPEPMVPGKTVEIALPLNAVAYRFVRGRRLRLAISTSYWPMVWPAPEPVTMTLETAGSALDLPLRGDASADAEQPAFGKPEMSPPYASTRLAEGESTRTLARDMASGTLILHHIEDTGLTRIEDIGLTVGKRGTETYTIAEGDPASA